MRRWFLIWSNQHQRWWGPNGCGYTPWIEDAGRYEEADAEAIVVRATLNGRLTHRVESFVDGRELSIVDEVMVPAPHLGSDRDDGSYDDEGPATEDHPAAPVRAGRGEADNAASATGAPAATGAPTQDPDAPPYTGPAFTVVREVEL